jgi:hypothetical protein
LIGVVLRAQAIELGDDPAERGFDVGDGALGIVRALSLETSLVLDEFLSVELGDGVLRADRPRAGHQAWHADPQQKVVIATEQVYSRVKRSVKIP